MTGKTVEQWAASLTPTQRKREAAVSRRILRQAWKHRHTHPRRAHMEIEANVSFLRALR